MNYLQEFCETGDLVALSRISNEMSDFALKLSPIVLEKYPNSENIYHRRALQIMELFDHAPEDSKSDNSFCSIKGLRNIGESCYLDSALLALFVTPDDFVDDFILNTELKMRDGPRFDCAPDDNDTFVNKQLDLNNRQAVQIQLRDMANSIRGLGNIKNCNYLRHALKNCPNEEEYHRSGEKDAGEFLGYILSMFDTNVAHKQTITHVTNDSGDVPENLIKVNSVDDIRSSVVQFVDSHKLLSLNQEIPYYISKFLSSISDDKLDKNNRYNYRGIKYNRRIAKETLVSTPYLIFNIQRENVFSETLRTQIIPSETLTINNGNRFKLSAVVVHNYGHYMAYFKCSNWYFYDDIDIKPKLIGDYKKMLKQRPSPITHGTIYYYQPL
jgi:ubiquitin C-terminal hydrolase